MYKLYRHIGKHLVPVAILLLILAVSWSKMSLYFNVSKNAIWLCLSPFILYVKDKKQFSYRYSFVAILFMVFYALTKAPIFFFFSFCFVLFLILETFYGRLNYLAPVMIIVITPLTKYLFDIFSFPIRLWLSKLAATFLNHLGLSVVAQGNVLLYKGSQFAVDTACMGLNMVITSLLIALLLTSHFERRSKATAPFYSFSLIMGTTVILVIIANLLRIILLILFQSPPETISHELIGLAALIITVVFPLYFLVRKLSVTFRPRQRLSKAISQPVMLKYIVAGLAFFTLACYGFAPTNYQDIPEDDAITNLLLTGYEKEILPNHIGKFTSSDALVYIKPGKEFFRTNHTPDNCWRGSGYEIKNVQIQELAGKQFYLAQLVSSSGLLYTAWWYDNGECQTADQLDWRWKSLLGAESFRLINVTARDQRKLIKEVKSLITNPLPFSKHNQTSI